VGFLRFLGSGDKGKCSHSGTTGCIPPNVLLVSMEEHPDMFEVIVAW